MPNNPYFTMPRDKRFKLIKPSLKEFISNPYNELTVSGLTDAMGILRTDFYYYFKDKDDLYDAIIDNILYFTKPSKDHPIDDLIEAIFVKTVRMQGPRNQKFVLECVSNYHPEFLDHLFFTINKKSKRVVKPEVELKERLAFYKLLSVIKMLKEEKITLDESYELMNIKK